MVVHPGAGNKSGTLLNALLHEYPELKKLPRAGIVHRLDKDTSGLMVVARNEPAMQSLSEQISNRSIKRIYQAFTVGRIERSGKIEAPIGRHPKNRQKQAIIESGREAISHYKVIENFGSYSHLEVKFRNRKNSSNKSSHESSRVSFNWRSSLWQAQKICKKYPSET